MNRAWVWYALYLDDLIVVESAYEHVVLIWGELCLPLPHFVFVGEL